MNDKDDFFSLLALFENHLKATKKCKPAYLAQSGKAECTLVSELNALVYYGVCPPKKGSALFKGLLRLATIDEDYGGPAFSQHKKWNTTRLLGLRRKLVFRNSEFGLWNVSREEILDQVIKQCSKGVPIELILEKDGSRHSCLVVGYESRIFWIANYYGKKRLAKVNYSVLLPLVDTSVSPEIFIEV